jgi:hypothetical protein
MEPSSAKDLQKARKELSDIQLRGIVDSISQVMSQ